MFELRQDEIRHDKWRRGSDESSLIRVTHIPTGEYIERDRPANIAVHDFEKQLLLELADLVQRADWTNNKT